MSNERTVRNEFWGTSEEHLTKVKKKVDELEKRMGYKCQSLSQGDQERLDTEFRNAIRMRIWLD